MANRHRRWWTPRDSTATTVSFLPAIQTPHAGRTTSTIPSSMKWRTTKQQQQQPFLVLPLLEHERSVSAESQLMRRRRQRTPPDTKPLMMVSNTPTTSHNNRNISASTTDTWPPKHHHGRSIGKSKKRTGVSVIEIERPLTATLERPVLLNIGLLDKLDMSRVRKEFLCITNLCRLPVKHNLYNNKASERKCIKTRARKPETTSEDSVVDSDENTSVRSRARARKVSKMMNQTSPTRTIKNNVRQLHIVKQKQSNDANNNNTVQNRDVVEQQCAVTDNIDSSASIGGGSVGGGGGTNKHKVRRSPKPIDAVFSGPKTARTLPEPCKTCGRPDQPERFHSHPATPLVRPAAKRTIVVTPNTNKHIMKNSVQKPVAMKYKGTKQKAPAPPAPTTTPVPSVAPPAAAAEQNTKPKSPQRGPRTVICYICGREFGTASLPLHEPKCLQVKLYK